MADAGIFNLSGVFDSMLVFYHASSRRLRLSWPMSLGLATHSRQSALLMAVVRAATRSSGQPAFLLLTDVTSPHYSQTWRSTSHHTPDLTERLIWVLAMYRVHMSQSPAHCPAALTMMPFCCFQNTDKNEKRTRYRKKLSKSVTMTLLRH